MKHLHNSGDYWEYGKEFESIEMVDKTDNIAKTDRTELKIWIDKSLPIEDFFFEKLTRIHMIFRIDRTN